jgi:hypothetical protein
MNYRSEDGTLEVFVDSTPNEHGQVTVSARQLVGGDITAHINVIYGSGEDYTTLVYRTQDSSHFWAMPNNRKILGIRITVILPENVKN